MLFHVWRIENVELKINFAYLKEKISCQKKKIVKIIEEERKRSVGHILFTKKKKSWCQWFHLVNRSSMKVVWILYLAIKDG
jgi:hypothetical protein